MNALTLVFVALCLFDIGYRFYGLFIARKVLAIDPNKLTPAGSEHEQPTLGGQRSEHRNGHRGFPTLLRTPAGQDSGRG